MTRAQLFVTLSLVVCATTPCADGMSAAPPPGPIGPDSWWPGFNEMRATVAASLDGTTARIAEGVLAVLLAWYYRSLLARGAGTGRRRRTASLRTIVGGLPAPGVMGGPAPLRQPPGPTPPSPMPSVAGGGTIAQLAMLDPIEAGTLRCPSGRASGCHG